jgi:hypothetical protein
MKLVVFGGGDLAQRILALLPTVSTVEEVLIVTGEIGNAAELARLYNACLTARVRGRAVAWSRPAEIVTLLAHERPDIVFHASAFVSPWLLEERDTPASRALSQAGFGIMLPAQLPKIRAVMMAVRELGLSCPVINASYPDVTHAVLATEGLAPVIGVGNAGMILLSILDGLQEQGRTSKPHLLAHHGQVTPFARGEDYAPGEAPWLFLDGAPASIAGLEPGLLPRGRPLNALTASHAVTILKALLGQGGVLHTSVPGPMGLPGGWPVRISREGVELDLPARVSIEEATAYQHRAAVADGISGIDADGTVFFTEATRAALAPVAPDLAEPLRRENMTARLALLMATVAA